MDRSILNKEYFVFNSSTRQIPKIFEAFSLGQKCVRKLILAEICLRFEIFHTRDFTVLSKDDFVLVWIYWRYIVIVVTHICGADQCGAAYLLPV